VGDEEETGARRARVVVAVAVVLLSGCSRGVYHRVHPGESLFRISKAYGVSANELARVNKLRDPARIEVGQRLFIPGARRELPVNVITPLDANTKPIKRLDGIPAGAKRMFTWPVASGGVSSGFGPRGSTYHDGIDIAAPIGTPVLAAADGEVIYSDRLAGYGNLVIVGHGGGYATVYAHNRENKVREGARVHRNQVIALVGDTGHTTGPNLHFEVRYENVARNPLYFLPQTVVGEK